MTEILTKFYNLTKLVDEKEKERKKIKKQLTEAYDELVQICPHSEAVDRKSELRGMGTTRRCKICGITDYASEGGTPGDEYDYGTAGYPSTTFWVGANVETVTEKEFWKYDRTHEWVVTSGEPRKRFA